MQTRSGLLLSLLIGGGLIHGGPVGAAASEPEPVSWSGIATNAQGETLARVFVNTSETPDLADWGRRAGELCVAWYPKLAQLLASDGFTPATEVRLNFRDGMGGVAATSRHVINISANFVRGATNDFGMVIHELTHVVQDYRRGGNPGWLVEGVADYIRLTHFEPEASRPRIDPDRASYRDSYKTTAAFLEWVEQTHDPKFVQELNRTMREGRFKPGFFAERTGRTVDELWGEFTGALRRRDRPAAAQTAERELVSLANPLQGTDSTGGFSHGNTFPAIALPFPMNVWAPYTEPARDSFYYQYRQNKIRGIRQTHQPSPWIGDYANFSLMPVSGKLVVKEDERASEFRHETEVARPSYYRVRLNTWKATAEVTPTERAASFRFTFEENGDAYVVLDAFDNNSSVEIIPSENKIVGICRNNRGGVPGNFANHFVVVFDRPFVAHGTWTPESVNAGETKLSAKHAGAYLKFNLAAGQRVSCKVASSYISAAQAQRNLEREIGSADFDTVLKRADAKWNETFDLVRIEGGTEEQRRTFYSAFYRSVIFPHRFYELDEQGKPVYYSPYDGKIHSGFLYTDTGFWDTFRASHPLYNLLFPEISAEIMQGLLAAYDQSGWLPSWSSPGHRDCMIGNHAFSLLTDAWVKGITNFDAGKAVDAMVHDANHQSPPNCRAIGRDGAEFYNKMGYAPYPEVREATAKTLEYAYGDFCAAVLARRMGRHAEAEAFARSAMNYTNVFDAKLGFVRGRRAGGEWCENFDPTEWGGPFTEGNSWHWAWSVFQDVPGLVKLLGGDEAFGRKLDAVFYTPPDVKVGTYGGMIHEMTEMIALNLGQYAHGNQPIQHAIYLYNYAGQPWKTQARVRQVMNLLYQSTPDGLCGDEDTGQMSSWYVFSALGFYPVCPGSTEYLIGSPLFDRVTLKLPNGKQFVVTASRNGPQRPYIHGAALNGESFNKTFLTHEQIMRGGEVVFRMDSAPDYKWATAPDSRPVSAMSLLSPLQSAAAK